MTEADSHHACDARRGVEPIELLTDLPELSQDLGLAELDILDSFFDVLATVGGEESLRRGRREQGDEPGA
jgi:hypothetical protein